jgi:hypothetical protein
MHDTVAKIDPAALSQHEVCPDVFSVRRRTLVRKIVQLHGGTVVRQSEGAGHGAIFTVRPARSRKARGRHIERFIVYSQS